MRTTQFCRELVFAPGSITDEEIVETLLGIRVALVADAATLASNGGQSAVTTVARLVLGYGASLRLVMPEVPVVGSQPPLRGRSLRAGLVDLAGDVIPGAGADIATKTDARDLVLVFGGTPWAGEAADAWRVGANAWGGQLGPTRASTSIATEFPIGSLAAAAIASAEPFKRAMRHSGRPLRMPEALERVERASVSLAPNGTGHGPLDLGRVDCISGGAIVNGALFALLRVPDLTAAVRVLEPQTGELSNVARYLLMRAGRSHLPKVEMLSEWSRPGFSIGGQQVRVTAEAMPSLRPLAPAVIVGTDRVVPRWIAQAEQPDWLVVGSTADWRALMSEHRPDQACAGCLHPYDEPVVGEIATISFVSFWAGLICAARLLRHGLGPAATTHQVSDLTGPLRLDNPRALRAYALDRNAQCPLHCGTTAARLT